MALSKEQQDAVLAARQAKLDKINNENNKGDNNMAKAKFENSVVGKELKGMSLLNDMLANKQKINVDFGYVKNSTGSATVDVPSEAIIATDFSGYVVEKQVELGKIFSKCNYVETDSAKGLAPVYPKGSVGHAWNGVGPDVDIAVADVEYSVNNSTSYTTVRANALTDTKGKLAEKLGEAVARTEVLETEKAILGGTVGTSMEGIVTALNTAKNRKGETVTVNVSTCVSGTVTRQELRDAIYSLAAEFQDSAVFIIPRIVMSAIEELTDVGGVTSLVKDGKLFDHEVIKTDVMPTDASGDSYIVVADLSQYNIIRMKDTSLKVDDITGMKQNLVNTQYGERKDGVVTDYNAFALIKNITI